MATPYIYERQVEYWTSRDIEDFFLDEGFQVLVFPLTQLTENKVPVDFLFMDSESGKLFGLQFKALYKNAEDHWNLDAQQHKDLCQYSWMYYGLSDMKEASQHRNALHYLRVLPPTALEYSETITRGDLSHAKRGYVRWASFFDDIRKCRAGLKVNSRDEFLKAIWPHTDAQIPRELSEIASEVFFVDFDKKRTARFSGVIR